MIEISLLHSNTIWREGLEVLLRETPDLRVRGSWADALDAAAAEMLPDVLVFEFASGRRAPSENLRYLRQTFPGVALLATVDCSERRCSLLPSNGYSNFSPLASHLHGDDCIQLALTAGVLGAIRGSHSFGELVVAIRTVARGDYWMDSETAERLARHYLLQGNGNGSRPLASVGRLSMREEQIVRLVAAGMSNKEIAADLCLAYSTVKNHMSAILQKLGLADRTQLALHGAGLADSHINRNWSGSFGETAQVALRAVPRYRRQYHLPVDSLDTGHHDDARG